MHINLLFLLTLPLLSKDTFTKPQRPLENNHFVQSVRFRTSRKRFSSTETPTTIPQHLL